MNKRRDDFLLEMYKTLWNNIARAQNSLWAFIPTYTTIVGATYIYYEDIGVSLSILIIVSISVFFSSTAFNLNLWFVRNIELVSRIEYDFLEEKDLDSIVPERWYQGSLPFFKSEFFCIFGYVFAFFGITISIAILWENQNSFSISFLALVSTALYVLEAYYVRGLKGRYERLLDTTNKPIKKS